MTTWVIYRGPLERSRLSLLLQACKQAYGSLSFLWIFPGTMSADRLNAFHQYIASEPVDRYFHFQARLSELQKTRREVRRIVASDTSRIICIGFTSIWFVPRVRQQMLVWCVNGIPEEKSLASRSGLVVAHFQWLVTRWLRKPSLVIVVSKEMGKLVSRRMPGVPWVAVPTCVDLTTFRSNIGTERLYFTYLGTGAPWQALDLLADLWGQLYKIDQSLKFRVISRDSRCQILASQLPSEAISFVSSSDFKEVAAWLNEAEVGFLVRVDNLINRVSFPTKLAEYLASGAWVVSSDFPWAVRDHLQKHQCGIVIRNADKEAVMEILTFRRNADRNALAAAIKEGADELDRDAWVNYLVGQLQQLQ